MCMERASCREDFEVGIICALSLEYNAVSYLFDEFWDEDGDQYGRAAGDPNNYTTGRMGHYSVVLALLPHMGKANAASAAASMRASYSGLRLVILVGICGAVPYSWGSEILLGDVVISKTVIQYDLGRQYGDQFIHKDTIDDSIGRLNKDIHNLINIFETDRGLDWLEKRAVYFLQQIHNKVARTKRRTKYDYPGASNDKLFEPTYRHKHHVSPDCICRHCASDKDPVCEVALGSSCADLGCDEKHLVTRERLFARHYDHDVHELAIHLGAVASGDKVVKSAVYRDKIARETGVIAFEMEGAGVWDEVPSFVVKGVCDYADSHKHKGWQNFAAATAASVSKAILERYIRTDKAMKPPVGADEYDRRDGGSRNASATPIPRPNVGAMTEQDPRLMEERHIDGPFNATFSNSGPGDQFNAPGGTQNISRGNGNQFPGATFHGPVQFG
ncbi:nucleoside phosphorylase domain-containing protein [Penicillium cataractarum]|uniref:Nucleoside phosphorylase domain-containing protein n=1 Tax=Penicillium cataractarum TaxID=2100454 RepID=A0A9W9VWU4_9EURO|nr:nucleoside phosphorylase domain-containing protein [Penicillium cataractarum]KAJ5390821.1 nucleoside phosphorylase domain-containing protein [Penicillium cataractarum]